MLACALAISKRTGTSASRCISTRDSRIFSIFARASTTSARMLIFDWTFRSWMRCLTSAMLPVALSMRVSSSTRYSSRVIASMRAISFERSSILSVSALISSSTSFLLNSSIDSLSVVMRSWASAISLVFASTSSLNVAGLSRTLRRASASAVSSRASNTVLRRFFSRRAMAASNCFVSGETRT